MDDVHSVGNVLRIWGIPQPTRVVFFFKSSKSSEEVNQCHILCRPSWPPYFFKPAYVRLSKTALNLRNFYGNIALWFSWQFCEKLLRLRNLSAWPGSACIGTHHSLSIHRLDEQFHRQEFQPHPDDWAYHAPPFRERSGWPRACVTERAYNRPITRSACEQTPFPAYRPQWLRLRQPPNFQIPTFILPADKSISV